jgi:hypothetical protein
VVEPTLKSHKWRQLRSYPTRILIWFLLVWLPLVTLSVNAGVIYLAAIMQPFENHEKVIRIIATGLQAIGWIAVFYGVLKTRKQFGMPSVWRNLNDWWKQRPKYSQNLFMPTQTLPLMAFQYRQLGLSAFQN